MSRGSLLYGEFADRYDLHTPPTHYRHDHDFLLARARCLGSQVRLLDLGCGTGVFLAKAVAAGIDAHGLDPAPAMLDQARTRVSDERLIPRPMQELDVDGGYDMITALSWSFNYCVDFDEASDVLDRCHRALRPGGLCILQLAHAPHAPGEPPEFMVDHEPGPGGVNDIVMRYRFWSMGPSTLIADYSFQCRSTGEGFDDLHELHAADASIVAARAKGVGFHGVELLANCRGEAFAARREGSISPFLVAKRSS